MGYPNKDAIQAEIRRYEYYIDQFKDQLFNETNPRERQRLQERINDFTNKINGLKARMSGFE